MTRSTGSGQSARELFTARCAERILVFDGGYGTAIQQHKLQEADYRGDLDLPLDQWRRLAPALVG